MGCVVSIAIGSRFFRTDEPSKRNRVKCGNCGTWLYETDDTGTLLLANRGTMFLQMSPHPVLGGNAAHLFPGDRVHCAKCFVEWFVSDDTRTVYRLETDRHTARLAIGDHTADVE